MSPLPARFADGNILAAAQLNAFIDYLTSELNVPSGGTSARPSSPTRGQVFMNTSTNRIEIYNGRTWVGFLRSDEAPDVDLSGVIKPTRTLLYSNNNLRNNALTGTSINMSTLPDYIGVVVGTAAGHTSPLFLVAKGDITSSGLGMEIVAGGVNVYLRSSGGTLRIQGNRDGARIRIYRVLG